MADFQLDDVADHNCRPLHSKRQKLAIYLCGLSMYILECNCQWHLQIFLRRNRGGGQLGFGHQLPNTDKQIEQASSVPELEVSLTPSSSI